MSTSNVNRLSEVLEGNSHHGDERYLDVNEVCKFLKIGRSKFYELLADRESGLEVIAERPRWAGGRVRIASWNLKRWASGNKG